MTIGVLGYQGGCDLHINALNTLNIKNKKVLFRDDFSDLSGIILPGGESSVQYQYCLRYELIEKIKAFAATGKTILGTCAGTILLSDIKSEKVSGFGLIDIDIERNTYGSQINSGLKISDNGAEIMFIRAPGILSTGPNVEILDSYNGKPIFVKEKNIYCATFHPEVLHFNKANILNQIFGA